MAGAHGGGGSANGAIATRPLPADLTAERSLLGAVLLPGGVGDAARAAALSIVAPEDFIRTQHGHILDAVGRLVAVGAAVDTTTVASELRRQGLLDDVGGHAELLSLMVATPASSSAARYASDVVRVARLRRLIGLASDAIGHAYGEDLDRAMTTLAYLNDEMSGAGGRVAVPTLEEFMDSPEPEYDWLVPGLLERGDRVLLTGGEGKGKTVLMRQVAVTVAAGLHPFSFEPTAPGRVLFIDLENPEAHTRRMLRPLQVKAAERGGGTKGHMFVLSRPEGIDLLNSEAARWLDAVVADVEPDLITVGPLYKLSGGDPDREKDTVPVTRVIDRFRARHHCAVLIEAHSPHAQERQRRPARPIGSSVWLRWPEFGLSLSEDSPTTSKLEHWRGDRDVRSWPSRLRRGGAWPWTIDSGDNGADESLNDVIVSFVECSDGEAMQKELIVGLRGLGVQKDEKEVRRAAEQLVVDGRLRARGGGRGKPRLYGIPWPTDRREEEF